METGVLALPAHSVSCPLFQSNNVCRIGIASLLASEYDFQMSAVLHTRKIQLFHVCKTADIGF